MNLNPIQWITDGVASVVSSYQTSKQARVEAKAAVAGKKIDYKLAKWEAKISLLKAQGKHDASYDMQVLKNRQITWLDEVLGVSIVLMTVLAFIPGVAPYIKDGWDAVSQAPFWFQFAWYVLIVSTLGGLTVLRILMGTRGRASLPQKSEITTSPESHPDNDKTLNENPQRAYSDHTDQQEKSPRPHLDQGESTDPVLTPEQERREQPSYERTRPGPPHGGGR